MKKLLVVISALAGIILFISVILALNTSYFKKQDNFSHKNKNPVITYIKKDIIAKNWMRLTKIQRELSGQISKTLKQTDSDEFLFFFFISLGLSFIYGMIHSIGPGHGKIIIISYFLSEKPKLWEAPVMAIQVAATHIASALILVLLVNVSLRQVLTDSVDKVYWIKIISYSLITIVGIMLLGRKIFEKKLKEKILNLNRGILSIAAGMIPCTGALLILLFAMANNVLIAGIFMVIAIGLGIMTTLSAVGIVTMLTKKAATRETFFTRGKNISTALEYLGACAIVSIGAIMLTLTITA